MSRQPSDRRGRGQPERRLVRPVPDALGFELQMKRAESERGYLIIESGFGQAWDGEGAAEVVDWVVEQLDALVGVPRDAWRVARLDLVGDRPERPDISTLRPPARSRMIWAQYHDPLGREVETYFLRNRSRALRIYDKAVESGAPGPWWRVEHQLRRRWVERVVGSERRWDAVRALDLRAVHLALSRAYGIDAC